MKVRRDMFQAIADPTRRASLTLVALQAMTPGAIAEEFDTSRQTISKHLQILTDWGILQLEQNGRRIYYHLNSPINSGKLISSVCTEQKHYAKF